MNTSQLKSYAPQARKAFIDAVTAQAARLGITAKETAAAEVQGDVLLVNGQAFPKSAQGGRNKLISRVAAHGFQATMDAVAYTWFNRFVAIRYMELHNYLDHGYRVLSDPDGSGRPEILDKAADVDLPGLDRAKVVELKLDGTKDEELYRLLIKAQCNALNKAMPFLFERIGDETELLLPANLLHSDSLIRQLVESIEESAWNEIEIIGWLYQFYISEKKDEVIGKVVKSEDIPAATQLFTPNWIVKYMVQNSLGAQWLATYPNSSLKGQMEYYIEPAEQTDEVNAQLAAITPTALNPEEITLIDPACGSGHILVEAYDLFKAIYVERGFREREAAKLILEKNLYGIDIDQRAAQLSGFALMMKGRADDRRLFERDLKLNVMAMVNSEGFETRRLDHEVNKKSSGLQERDLQGLKKLFEHATTFGSLIQVPDSLTEKLPALQKLVEDSSDYLYVDEALERLTPLVQQAKILSRQYDNVVANPPYMGENGMNPFVKAFAKRKYPTAKSDLFAVSTERFFELSRPGGIVALMTPFTWMFLKSYVGLRTLLVERKTLHSLIQPELHSFFDSAYVSVCTFVARNSPCPSHTATFINLAEFYGAERQPEKTREAIQNPRCGWLYRAKPDDFKKVPGLPVAYGLSERMVRAFESGNLISKNSHTRKGMATGLNARFVRTWNEVSRPKIGFGMTRLLAKQSQKKWFPYANGGVYRKWYGNYIDVVDWELDGHRLQTERHESGRVRAVNLNLDFIFKPGLSWTSITSGYFSIRELPTGFLFSSASNALFSVVEPKRLEYLALLNSKVHERIARVLNPTLNANPGDIAKIPTTSISITPNLAVKTLVLLSKSDWDSYEYSWDFQSLPLLAETTRDSLESSYTTGIVKNTETITEMKRLEEENNRLFIHAYGLQDELTPDVPLEQITLTVNPAYRYGIKGTEEERQIRFREDTMQELVSYAIGCMMGRYSLDQPGLIYAYSGNEGFDASRYTRFPADDDGIIPLTDSAWFEDDAANRLVEFLSAAWNADHLEENLTFLAANLSPKKNESARDTLRNYLCDKFFKDHLQTYKNRPIYWLFSSGKQKAFQCLVYLHRYNEGTLSRMRSEYVIPLQGKMAARLEHLKADTQVANSSAQQKRLEKESEKLKKQQVELLAFDEKLRHYADRRITLDLDDGVKVNYGKFGSLLAEVTKVHGQKAPGP